jgi:hypothetical protein
MSGEARARRASPELTRFPRLYRDGAAASRYVIAADAALSGDAR